MLITAASLEAIEGVLDGVPNKAPGAVPWCEVRLTANASTAAITDLFAQNNWSAPTGGDQFGMVKPAPANGTYTYIQVPAGWPGRYRLRYHSTTSGMGSGGTHAAKITLNAASVASLLQANGFTVHREYYVNDAGRQVDILAVSVWLRYLEALGEKFPFPANGYKGGWANVPDPDPRQFVPDRQPTIMDKLRTALPPDVDGATMGPRYRGFAAGPDFVTFPDVKPMWFHYRNPVSGRVPERYWPDCVPSRLRPDTGMTAHGYQLPPAGPSVDGVEVG